MSKMSLIRSNSCELVEVYSSSERFEFESEKRSNLNGAEDFSSCGDVTRLTPICSNSKFDNKNTTEEGMLLHKHQDKSQVKLVSASGNIENLYFDAGCPPFQSSREEISKLVIVESEDLEVVETQRQKSEKLPLASLALLKSYRSRFRLLEGERTKVDSNALTCTKFNGCKVSSDAVIRLAGESFIKSSVQGCDDLSDNSPWSSKLRGFSAADAIHIELVKNLLASAESVGQEKFQHARKLLNRCSEWSSDKGNPVQRLVYYFSAALSEKIDHEIGRYTTNNFVTKQYSLYFEELVMRPKSANVPFHKEIPFSKVSQFEEAVMSPKSANIAFHKEVPFSQVSLFTGVQAIIEHVAEAKKVHIIDFVIMSGCNCIVLMQAFAARHEHPLEHLRITAIGTKSPEKIEETGKRLMSFAESINLPFSFNVVMVADMLDLSEDLFELNAEEVVAVQSSYIFSAMIAKSDQLECIMRVIRNIDPSIMVVIEKEGNNNSPVFVNRFIEALFYYGALFDCLEDCMERSNPNRLLVESIYYSPAIQNIVVAEGKERTTRQVDMSVWRAFFARFGMIELELSKSSLYQARLVTENFACGSSCTLDRNEKCLIIGWKGTPILSLSAWKFD